MKTPKLNKLVRVTPQLNAFTFQFDPSLLDEIRTSYDQELLASLTHPRYQPLFEGGVVRYQSFGNQDRYHLASYGSHPLLWISSSQEESYQLFRHFFDKLEIENDVRELLDYEQKIIVYCGFLVVSNRAPSSSWHVDYFPGANAFTLITPLFELDPEHGRLLYLDQQHSVQAYSYRLGEAIIFGDHFVHSTEIYHPTQQIRVLVSMTFGTDKLKYWGILNKTIGNQSKYFKLPCGHVAGTCDCVEFVPRSYQSATQY